MSFFGAMAGAFLAVFIIAFLAVYIYTSFALMTIANRLKVKNSWLAWIPIANLYLMTQCAKVPWWTMLVILISWIPIIGGLAMAGVGIWWWWNIAERRGKEGWFGILMIIPIVNLIIMGVLAWGKK